MKYTSINIQGNLISEEILHKVEEADAQGQLVKDFGFESVINLRNEIEYAWSRIKLDWKHFFDRTEKLPSSDPYGTTLSRKWMVSFFSTLGYDLTLQKASLQGDNQQLYSISHTCDQLDGSPVHIVGFYDPSHPNKNTLDIRSSGGTSRLSPHSTIQEYLNVSDHLYAMVTNGLILRLVRDSGRLVKMTYIEFDLKRLLEDDKYSEFTLLYRLLHASRFPKSKQDAEQCFLEKYYQDSIESGNRIREGLSDAVKESLVALGNGLLEHPENEELREKITSGRPDAREFYHQLLRLIYRLLFLMVTEERDLVFSDLEEENREPDMDDLLNGIKRPTRKQKEIYYNFYSLVRLRKLSQKRYLLESQYSDLWQGLMQAFALFESGGTGRKLGIQALGSELFSSNAMPDITSSKLNNRVLLQCIKSLNEFEDEKHNLSFINYRALDVEELGSVYEGLLELEPVFEWENGKPRFTFRKGSERSSSGSHYTPEDLVKPLIQHSLEYLIEERVTNFYKGKANSTETIKKLFDLKICDIACGSGHILLSAARRIALEIARVETGEQQPNPTSFRHALKEVIKTCIYGVDKNPLAVELCKVALWLESHNPGEPLSFLDHRIKCGDAIVGLSNREELQNGIDNEAFKKLSGDDKNIASAFLKKNREERTLREKSGQTVQLTTETNHKLMEQVRELNRLTENFSTLPENSPEEIEKKEKAYRILINSDSLRRLKIIADLQIMPFFIPKIVTNKDLLLTDSQFFRFLRGETHVSDIVEMQAMETGLNYRFFHWFLEFPEVFIQGGFSCIVGNPPYLGGTKISTNFGDYYQLFLKAYFRPIGGRADLIAYFVKRMFHLISNKAFLSIIATNSISQGETREGGLAQILKHQGKINFAVSSTPWPGKAAVEVSLLAITKRKDLSKLLLNGKQVENISSYLDNEITNIEPYKLIERENECFLGHYISGSGFVLTNEEARKIIHLGQKYKDVIFPYLNGQDLNSEVDQKATRSVIYFDEMEEIEAKNYEIVYSIVHEKVYPERVQKDIHKYPRMVNEWWKFWMNRKELVKSIKQNNRVLVTARVSKIVTFSFVDNHQIFDEKLVVFKSESFLNFSILCSNLHTEWAWKYCTTLESRFNYTPNTIYDTFPFPRNHINRNIDRLEAIGKAYYEHRDHLMKSMQLGLTKTYNAFHAKEINDIGITKQFISGLNKKTFEKKNSKEVWNLWNHLQKIEGTCSFEDAVDGLLKLRELHVEMDKAVLETYGWQDIDLRHDFYEVDYLPQNDLIRFTIHPDARKEVLKRLLDLNHRIHAEEVKAGLWDKKKTKKRKLEDNSINKDQVNEQEAGYGGLFGDLTNNEK